MPNMNLSDAIANEMDKVLESEENKQLFSSSSVLEKLAFKRVADQDQKTEVEQELEDAVEATIKTASTETPAPTPVPQSKVAETVSTLVKVSEDLDAAGFDRLAAASLLLAEKLIAEAKAKKSKDSKKSDKSDKAKESPKSKSKKMTMKERMDKMRKMKGKKDSKKDTKKK